MNKTVEAPVKRIPQGWSTPPTLESLVTNLNDAKPYHDTEMSKVHKYRQNLHIEGDAKPKARKGFSSVQPQLIRKHAEWRYSALTEAFLATLDMYKVKPRTAADKLSAKQNEVLLNYQWNNVLNKVSIVDEMVRADVDDGTVIFRTGWIAHETEETVTEPVFEYYPATEQAQVQELQQAAMLQQKDPYAYKQHIPEHIQQALTLTEQMGQPIYPVVAEQVEVTRTKLLKNEPTVEVCVLDNLYVDPSCQGDLDKAEFVIYSFETSRGELRKEGDKYFNLDAIKVDTGSLLAEPDHKVSTDDTFNFKDDPRQKFIAYEYWGYWDVDGSGVTTPFVATWVNGTMIRLEENPFPDGGLPFVAAQYMPRKKSLYGEPDGALLEDNQKIIGAVTRGSIDIMARSANAQQGIRQDALDVVNKRKFERGDHYEFNPMVDPRSALIEHTYSEIPNSVGLMLSYQNNEAESLTGVKPYSGGLSGDSLGETATAVRGVLDAATKRESAILRRLTQAMTKIAKKLVAMNAEFLSDEEIVRVTDEDFVVIRREDLEGSFDLEVTVSSAEEDNAKAQELSFMMQTMGNTVPMEFSQMILADIASLRKMPNLSKRIEDFRPQPDPVEQQKQQLEIAKMQLEVAELEAKTLKLRAAAQLDMAKAGEAAAKSGNIQSDTDQKNLDFLEQESGVKHARSVQQDKAQAEGNMALEILKADLATDNKPQVS